MPRWGGTESGMKIGWLQNPVKIGYREVAEPLSFGYEDKQLGFGNKYVGWWKVDRKEPLIQAGLHVLLIDTSQG